MFNIQSITLSEITMKSKLKPTIIKLLRLVMLWSPQSVFLHSQNIRKWHIVELHFTIWQKKLHKILEMDLS